MSAVLTPAAAGGTPAALAGKYLVFALGSEEFAIAVLKVREIVGIQSIVALPQVPPQYLGVINLRGRIIPVVDLRVQFGMAREAVNERTCIVVAQVGSGASAVLTGVLVDRVVEVDDIHAANIENPPDFGAGESFALLGMAKKNGRVKMLLDLDRTMCAGDLLAFSQNA